MWRATSICSGSPRTWSQTGLIGQQVPAELEAVLPCPSLGVDSSGVGGVVFRLLLGLSRLRTRRGHSSRAERTGVGAQMKPSRHHRSPSRLEQFGQNRVDFGFTVQIFFAPNPTVRESVICS